MPALALAIRERAELVEIGALEQSDAVGKIETVAGVELVSNVAQLAAPAARRAALDRPASTVRFFR
jgi:hypothetical protein